MPAGAGGCLSKFCAGGDVHSSPDANFPSALQNSGQGHMASAQEPEDVSAKPREGAGQSCHPAKSSLGAPLALTPGPSTRSPPEDGAPERPSLNL